MTDAGIGPGSSEGGALGIVDGPRTARFWRGYVLAWLPALTGYFGFILAGATRDRIGYSLLLALINVVPAALFGVVPVVLALRWPVSEQRWRGAHGRVGFVLRHAAAASVYSLAWWAGVIALLSIEWSVVRGVPTLATMTFAERRWQLSAGLLLYAAVAAIVMAMDQATRLRETARRAERAEALHDRAALAAVRAQLNPHFLFNTLHSLLELVRSGDPRAEDAIERFATLSRYAFDPRADGSAEVPVRREVAVVHDYLAIEALRLGERLRVTFAVDEAAWECEVPTLTLQPLVENAVRHAVAPRARGATIAVRIAVHDGVLQLGVRDDGPGADPGVVLSAPGVGLRAVEQRLALRYGRAGGVRVHTRPGAGFAVDVWLPARLSAADASPLKGAAP